MFNDNTYRLCFSLISTTGTTIAELALRVSVTDHCTSPVDAYRLSSFDDVPLICSTSTTIAKFALSMVSACTSDVFSSMLHTGDRISITASTIGSGTGAARAPIAEERATKATKTLGYMAVRVPESEAKSTKGFSG
jgi:hypothetical protein